MSAGATTTTTATKVEGPSTSAEDDAARTTATTKRSRLQRCVGGMVALFRDLAITTLVAFAYAALVNDPPKITKSPTAHPFFPPSSPVVDFHRGDIGRATEFARRADLAFIMFYAPWDAESRSARAPFEEAAQLFGERASFAAVNCWRPGGACRAQYGKVHRWPVMIAYAAHSRGVQYNGPIEARWMGRFLQAVASPFVKVGDGEELDDLVAKYDATVVAYINASPGQYNYAVLYTAALKFLERDPFQEIPFAIVTVGKQERPILELHMWNESWVYPEENEWLSEQIVGWIFKKLHQVTMWYLPTGMKSLQMSSFLQPGPSLILFSPKNPLWETSDMYSMLREVGLEYYNCDGNPRITNTQLFLREIRIDNYARRRDKIRKCKNLSLRPSQRFPLVVTHSTDKWVNGSQLDFCEKLSAYSDVCKVDCECANEKKFVDGDVRSAWNLQRIYREEKCRVFKIAEKYQKEIFSESVVDNVDYGRDFVDFNISGLACTTNASLTLIAMDSLLQHGFAERLGIDVFSRKDRTAAVIVDDKHEKHHIMQVNVNDLTLRQFIYNFTKNNLNRALDNPKYMKKAVCTDDFCINELSTETYLQTVMQQRKFVVVLYHSKQCFFCNGVSHVLLTTSNIFKNISFIEFARINGDLNILPWEYTMEKYPTVLLFPAYRKSESRVYPRNLPITVENLINFILANLDDYLRIPVMWTLCGQTKFVDEREECIKDVRLEILDLIEKNLKHWRKADRRSKMGILRQLRHLKSLHLLLAYSSHNFWEIDGRLKSVSSL